MACLPTESIRTELGVVGIRNYSRRDSLTWQHLGSQGERERKLDLAWVIHQDSQV